MKYLVTGAAGFIGMHVSQRLLADGHHVFGIDNLNDYYDVALKQSRLCELKKYSNFLFSQIDLADRQAIAKLFKDQNFQRVLHLGAQAGVRYSIESPFDYVDSNLAGMMTILEGCRHSKLEHLVYASSSSVYGMNAKIPFSVDDNVDHPVSLYAATKKSNELMAHSYSHLYDIPTTGLRFFTVYGPWGRPDMAPFLFTEAIIKNKPIKLFNNGNMQRDFTYIDDIVEGVVRVSDVIPEADKALKVNSPAKSVAPYQLFNIGNNSPIELTDFIEAIELACGKKAIKENYPMQPGDVYRTFADIESLSNAINFEPKTSINEGMAKFVDWYKGYYV